MYCGFNVCVCVCVAQECEEPVVDSREVDIVPSPCRTVSSLTSGDLADVSSLTSKASSLQHSSVGTSSSSLTGPPPARRPDFIMPPFRGAKTARYHPPSAHLPVYQTGPCSVPAKLNKCCTDYADRLFDTLPVRSLVFKLFLLHTCKHP